MYPLPGQTLKNVGVWLRSPVFAHGQLYVACSRVGKPQSLMFALKKKSDGSLEDTANVVFKEVLICHCPKCKTVKEIYQK